MGSKFVGLGTVGLWVGNVLDIADRYDDGRHFAKHSDLLESDGFEMRQQVHPDNKVSAGLILGVLQ